MGRVTGSTPDVISGLKSSLDTVVSVPVTVFVWEPVCGCACECGKHLYMVACVLLSVCLCMRGHFCEHTSVLACVLM